MIRGVVIIISLFWAFSSGQASEANHTGAFLLQTQNANSAFRIQLSTFFKEMEKAAFEGKMSTTSFGEKSVGKSIIFSALVPGAGQFYSGSYLKGAAFLLIEIATIVGQVHFNNRGKDFEKEFESLADVEWSEDAYWDWIASVSNRDRGDLQALRDWEHDSFSHFLPESKNQQYYENVGKYNQFLMGWRDFREDILGSTIFTLEIYRSRNLNGEDLRTISPTRNEYTGIRRNSNDNFGRATTLATLTLLNHALSALDAGWTTKKRNRRISTKVNFQGMIYDTKLVPALSVGIVW